MSCIKLHLDSSGGVACTIPDSSSTIYQKLNLEDSTSLFLGTELSDIGSNRSCNSYNDYPRLLRFNFFLLASQCKIQTKVTKALQRSDISRVELVQGLHGHVQTSCWWRRQRHSLRCRRRRVPKRMGWKQKLRVLKQSAKKSYAGWEGSMFHFHVQQVV